MPPRGVQVDGLERADHAPAASEAQTNDAIDVVDAEHAVAHEAVRLAQQRSLQPVEHEPLDLRPHADDAQLRCREHVGSAVDDLGTGERGRHELDDREEVRWVAGVSDEAAATAWELARDRRRSERRGARREDRLGRRRLVEAREQLSLELQALGGALLDVGRLGGRRVCRKGRVAPGRRPSTTGSASRSKLASASRRSRISSAARSRRCGSMS